MSADEAASDARPEEYEYRVADFLKEEGWPCVSLDEAQRVIRLRPRSLDPRIQRRAVGPWEDAS